MITASVLNATSAPTSLLALTYVPKLIYAIVIWIITTFTVYMNFRVTFWCNTNYFNRYGRIGFALLSIRSEQFTLSPAGVSGCLFFIQLGVILPLGRYFTGWSWFMFHKKTKKMKYVYKTCSYYQVLKYFLTFFLFNFF